MKGCFIMKKNLLNIGHRGAMNGGLFYENSMEAFMNARQMKLDGLETDIYMTKDEVLILAHHKVELGILEMWDGETEQSIFVNVNDVTFE